LRLDARLQHCIDRGVNVAAARIGLVAQTHQLEAPAEILAHLLGIDVAAEIDAEEAVGAFEHTLRAANSALGELHRNHRPAHKLETSRGEIRRDDCRPGRLDCH
jgi:predicted hotdog family 3-hydroxylacyl-ACP dehydratase